MRLHRPSSGALILILTVVVTMGGWALLAPPPSPAPFIAFNLSASIPVGFYRRVDGGAGLTQGLIVMAKTPAPLTDQYPIHMIKIVRGLPEDMVCYRSDHITVNGIDYGARVNPKPADSIAPGCYPIPPGKVLLLGSHNRSLDGRYFGPIKSDQVLGTYTPLLTWEL